MSTLVENAQKHIEQVMMELSGDDDFLPFMTIRDHNGDVVYVGMMMPEEGEAKVLLADVMTALCLVHRGVEATFASVTWMVVCDRMPDVAPAQHPDRTEEVFLLVMDAEGQCTMHTAPVIRENNMIGVGLWASHKTDAVAGRFAEAIRIGMDMGQQLPPDLCAWFDEEAEAGRREELVTDVMKMIHMVRREVFGE